ncbi:DUF4262 domain-containing protein [Mycolicibacterium wolinskyi]|uniref:DUF4262 domain-containing protein n=2 Tax=Mycobacteriaceae TaxID=1762 RepID=A0A1X2F4Z1_9MYCO|nr:DUF4262 domain-containing protein [Mycolicibacterium wolinskyi]MCV7292988.1 DUF4262 domain-containing protein [Mycolicibacterium goodii]ORX13492.1 hypothetical protein AWC31_30060 [Mycolicibacterium wolinskyi]
MSVVEDTRTSIAKHGWTVISVFPTAEDDGVPFAYTVGLSGKQLPELVIYGLPVSVGHQVLNAFAQQMIEAGRPVKSGQRITDVRAGDVELVAVEMTNTGHLTMVRRVYGSVSAAVQLCWPDVDGLFPWERGSRLGDDEQPVYGVAPSGRPVYRATRLPVDSAGELADLIVDAPMGSLTIVDPQADNNLRARRGATALIGYAMDLGKSGLDAELDTAATDMLADLRHLFDALGMDWEASLATADRNYCAEILGEI